MIMDNSFDSEATQLVNNFGQLNQSAQTEQSTINDKHKSKSNVKRISVGAVGGLLIGSVSTMLMGMNHVNTEKAVDEDENDSNIADLVDDQISVAKTVTDDMPFDEAFATARGELGSGGVFEWHGQIYSTYTQEEWGNMSLQEQSEYESHFSWNNNDVEVEADLEVESETVTSDTDNIPLVNSDAVMDEGLLHHNVDNYSEVEVLGVVHDTETGANIGGLVVDGNDVAVIDVDGDMVFDVMACDVNHDGNVDGNEIVDIHDQGLNVNDLIDPITESSNDFLASNEIDFNAL